MKKRWILLAPIVGFVLTLLFFSLLNRATANAPPTGQGNIQPQATNPFFTLTVTSAPSPVTVGSVVNYTIQLIHQPFDRIVVSSTIPQNTVFCPGSATASTAGWAFTPPVGDTGAFGWTNNSLPPGTTTTVFTFAVLVSTTAPINSNITLVARTIGFDCTPGCEPVSESELFATTIANIQPALRIDKTIASVANGKITTTGLEGDGLLVEPNGTINYRIAVTNFTKAIKPVMVTDLLPPQTTFSKVTHEIPPSSSLLDCDLPPSGGMGPLSCNFAIGPADTVIIHIGVNVKPNTPKGEVLVNCATASTTGSNCSGGGSGTITVSDCASISVGELADLAIEKKVTNVKSGGESLAGDRAEVGDILRYEIKVSNKGPGDAQNVRVADVLDNNLTLIVPPDPLYCLNGGEACDGCEPFSTGEHSCDSVGNSITIIYPKLKSGQDETITLFARVNCVPKETRIANTATVRILGEGNEDAKPDNNEASVTTVVNQPVPAFNCTPTTVVHPVQLCPTENSAFVFVPPPSFTSSCDNPLTVTGIRSDGKALDAAYPVGDTLINWTLVNAAGQPPTDLPCTTTSTTVRVNQKQNAITVTPPNFGTITFEGKKLPKKPFKTTFTLTNTCNFPLTVQLVNIQRDVAALCNAQLTNSERDDSVYFQVFAPNGTPLTPTNFVTLAPGTHTFMLQFKAFLPSYPANSNRLNAAEVLPTDFTKTNIRFQIIGDKTLDIRPQGTIVDQLVKLLDPICASRDGNNFTARVGVLDPTLKVQQITIEFYNDSGQRLGNGQNFTPGFTGKCRGQRYYLEITQATQGFPQSVRMRVTVQAGSLSRAVEVPVGQSCLPPATGQSITIEAATRFKTRR
jgi:uncharacterized repeat protein (TIGR01451 family)